ncbi:MAG: hypothetical protein K2Q20_01380 [Phycisphaerales bacterium]|nr:hypothetical protein [Phycisphaerales bacterium]
MLDLATLKTGELLVAGDFSTAPGQPRVGLAKFTTRPACLADWDCDGSARVPDIFAYIAGWFSGSARFDVDGDLRLSTGDIFAFLSAWFAGC